MTGHSHIQSLQIPTTQQTLKASKGLPALSPPTHKSYMKMSSTRRFSLNGTINTHRGLLAQIYMKTTRAKSLLKRLKQACDLQKLTKTSPMPKILLLTEWNYRNSDPSIRTSNVDQS